MQQKKEETQKQLDIQEHEDDIYYSPRYNDEVYEYRHVVLPKEISKYVPARLLEEHEWRGLGIHAFRRA